MSITEERPTAGATPNAKRDAITPPEPNLTPKDFLERAIALRPMLRERQAECEAAGKVPDDVIAELHRLGFYRIVQPARFGGYEVDIPNFYRIMMEVARGCSETGWVLTLTSGHPMIFANFSEEAQREAYGPDGHFLASASFAPPGKATPVEGGYRVNAAWASASGCDHATHHIGGAIVVDDKGGPARIIHLVLDRSQYEIIDDWQVMGMRGTGSKTVAARDVFVPTHRTIAAAATGRGADPAVRLRLFSNPMYSGRIAPFLVCEPAAVAIGAVRGALDIYEELLLKKASPYPPHLEWYKDPEFQRHYGTAVSLLATAEAALIRAAQEFMEYAADDSAGRHPFDDARAERVSLIGQQCLRMAWQVMDLIYRTAGTTASVKEGQPIGRLFRNLAAINTHPSVQIDRLTLAVARTRFGLTSPPPSRTPTPAG